MENVNDLRKRVKYERFTTHVFYFVIIVIILLLFRCCSGKKDIISNLTIQQKQDSINLLKQNVKCLENRHAVIFVQDTTVNKKHGKYVRTALVVGKDNLPFSSLFIADVKVPYRVNVPSKDRCHCKVVKPSYFLSWPPYFKNKDITINNGVVKNDPVLSNSMTVCLDKTYRQDSSRILFQGKIEPQNLLLNSTQSVNFNHKYIEYLPNPYRLKAEKAFWTGVGTAGAAALLYGASEIVGHPKYWDDQDNGAAKKKHNLILGLRTGSAILGGLSVISFGRTVYFHKMEGKFIVNPTSINLQINLNESTKK